LAGGALSCCVSAPFSSPNRLPAWSGKGRTGNRPPSGSVHSSVAVRVRMRAAMAQRIGRYSSRYANCAARSPVSAAGVGQ